MQIHRVPVSYRRIQGRIIHLGIGSTDLRIFVGKRSGLDA